MNTETKQYITTYTIALLHAVTSVAILENASVVLLMEVNQSMREFTQEIINILALSWY